MPAALPDHSARRAKRYACLRLGIPLRDNAVLHTTTMPLRSSTNAALHHTPAIAADHNLGTASVSQDPTLSATVPSSTVTSHALSDTVASTISYETLYMTASPQEWRDTAVWLPNPNYPHDPRPLCPPPPRTLRLCSRRFRQTLRYDPTLLYGLTNAPTLFHAVLPFRPPTPPLR